MGSKKHKEKDKERTKEKKKSRRSSRSRSREREREPREKHKHRDRKRTRGSEDDLPPVPEKVRVKEERSPPGRSKPDSPESEDEARGEKLSLSVDDTNKLRAKLGLKPLQVDSGSIPGLGDAPPGDVDEEQTEKRKEVFIKTENIQDKLQVEKLREKIAANREKRKFQKRYQDVKTIAESDEDLDDALAWVRKSRKLHEEKAKAAKRAKVLEELDEEFGVGKLVEEEIKGSASKRYSAKNLKGLEVVHDVNRIKEGHVVVLTLKDKAVLDDGDDVLENVNMVDDEKAERNVENKKRKPGYIPYEDTEVDEFGIVKKKSLLSKYDEELEGIKQDKFKIGVSSEASKERELEIVRMKLKQKQEESLVTPALQLALEYYTPTEMEKFKKPKKKVRKIRKRDILKPEELAPLPGHEADPNRDMGSRKRIGQYNEPAFVNMQSQEFFPEAKANVPAEEEDVVGPEEDLTGVAVEEDDSEQVLEAALTKARRLKRVDFQSVEKIAESVRKTGELEEYGSASQSNKSIILNSTAEFCRTLGDIPTYGMSGNRDEEVDELMDLEEEENPEEAPPDILVKGAWNEVDIDERPAEIEDHEKKPILEEEPDVSVGVAGALQLAFKKGYIEKDDKNPTGTTKFSHLQAQSYTIEEKFYDDDKASRRDRYSGPVSDFKEKETYKPDVKLEYIDDGGRILNAKEAFRYLSHKFHGKGSGKGKVDKRHKKVEQAVKLKQMSSTDTPLSTLKLLQEKQKELQTPYILLSGGSKAFSQSSLMKPK
ncbi:U4/U6.U5 tri-snRNP-associated protein 1-like [Ornithodoros turicata]|uniref:U4/U6.U5 tri-snRNP-associated protein 1-like n=1 Tax=Ornithodoros turicata TaxID=34597 RepID=UPI0031394095